MINSAKCLRAAPPRWPWLDVVSHWINGNLAWKIHVEPWKFCILMYFVHGNPARKSFHETNRSLNVVMYDSALRHCGSSLNHLSLHHLWIAIRLRHVVSIDNTRCGRAGPVFFKARFESRTATSGGYFVTYEGWCDQHSGAGFCPPPLCCCWWIMLQKLNEQLRNRGSGLKTT